MVTVVLTGCFNVRASDAKAMISNAHVPITRHRCRKHHPLIRYSVEPIRRSPPSVCRVAVGSSLSDRSVVCHRDGAGGGRSRAGATPMRQHVAMAHDRHFRFAAQLSKAPDGTARSWAEQARKVEDLGYSALLMPDHFDDQLAPVPALAAVAAATTTLRMGSLVFGNDYRHPFVLAKEAATLDVLSEGRLRAQPRGRLDAHRLRRGRARLRPPRASASTASRRR